MKMRLIVIFSLLFSVSAPALAGQVFWKDRDEGKIAQNFIDRIFNYEPENYLAEYWEVTHGVPAFMANPHNNTTFEFLPLHLPKGTKLAVYRNITDDSGKGRLLALDSRGYFVSIAPGSLVNGAVQKTAPTEQEDVFKGTPRISPIKGASKKYVRSIQACEVKRKFTFEGGGNIEAEFGLGIASVTVGGEGTFSETTYIGPGLEYVEYQFGRDNSKTNFITMTRSKTCGPSVVVEKYATRMQFGQSLSKRLEPNTFQDRDFDIAGDGRAIISCQKNYQSFVSYLNSLDIPPEWHQIIASGSARWRNFNDFTDCSHGIRKYQIKLKNGQCLYCK